MNQLKLMFGLVCMIFLLGYVNKEGQDVSLVPLEIVIVDPVYDAKFKYVKNILISNYELSTQKAEWYADRITVASSRYEIPVEIMIAMIATESEFNPNAVSKSNAIGSAQIIPVIWDGETPYDIHSHEENILAGAYILRSYYDECGSWEKALHAYNVGITNFKNGRKKSDGKRYVNKIVEELKDMRYAGKFKTTNV